MGRVYRRVRIYISVTGPPFWCSFCACTVLTIMYILMRLEGYSRGQHSEDGGGRRQDNGGISWGGKRTLRTLLPTNVQNIQYNGNGRHGIRIRSSNQPRLRYHFQRLYRVVHLQGWISIILGRSKGQANENLNTAISTPSLPIGGECKSMRRIDQWWTSKRGVTLNSS